MKKSSIILLSIFSFIAFPNLTAAAGTTVDSVSYSCAKNEVLRVVYVNGADGKSFDPAADGRNDTYGGNNIGVRSGL